MNILLGNLTVSEIEARLGIQFSPELKTILASSHQEKASDILPGKWHCYDIPFTLVCGDRQLATTIYEFLKPLNNALKTQLQIALSK